VATITNHEAAVFSAVNRVGHECRHRIGSKVEPQYTRRRGSRTVCRARVLLKVTIDIDGRAKDASVLESLGMGLDEMRWMPSTCGSSSRARRTECGPVEAKIEVNFRRCSPLRVSFVVRGSHRSTSPSRATVHSPTLPDPVNVLSVPCRMRRWSM